MYTEQHEVVTRWGHFLLDDASYAAYLEGRLWISWGTETKPKQNRQDPPHIPVNVSDRAIRLREAAVHQDPYYLLQDCFPGMQIAAPYRSRMSDLTIEEMKLSVRSSNALMRANAKTFGRVMEISQMENGFRMIRNLGVKSEKEILRNFFCACYANLTPNEQAVFWQKMIDREQ